MSANDKNIETKVEGNYLTIKIDLTKDLGPSKSGKSVMVGTTSGFMAVSTPKGDVKLSLNCIK